MSVSRPTDDNMVIRDVYAANVHEELHLIRQIVDAYPYVAMDTEFPGVVARPVRLLHERRWARERVVTDGAVQSPDLLRHRSSSAGGTAGREHAHPKSADRSPREAC
jgi:hypothetical protein